MTRRAFALSVALQTVRAQDWKLWGGPARDFRFPATLSGKWPAAGPKQAWSRPLGSDGHSGVAIEGGTLYTMYRNGSREVVTALAAKDGKTIWEHEYAVNFRNPDPNIGLGPHAMPQIVGDRVFTAGSSGIVHALDKRSGKVLWSHELVRKFEGTRLPWGYSCHGLPYRDNIIYSVGGSKALIALRQHDGSVDWARHQYKNAHSSPLLIQIAGLEQLVILHAAGVLAVNPINGDEQWRHAHSTDWGLAVATPVWNGSDLLLISSAYGTGSRVLRLSRDSNTVRASEVWKDAAIQIHFGTAASQGDWLIAASGHHTARVIMFDWKTGRVAWRSSDFAKAHVLDVGGKLLILDEDGLLALATATEKGLTVHAKAQVLRNRSWTPPTVSGNRIYLRDQRSLVALEG
ncbi:MAG: PQQ-binding-like beta-propeller repeat protein [Bryobacteraceae bacterium]